MVTTTKQLQSHHRTHRKLLPLPLPPRSRNRAPVRDLVLPRGNPKWGELEHGGGGWREGSLSECQHHTKNKEKLRQLCKETLREHVHTLHTPTHARALRPHGWLHGHEHHRRNTGMLSLHGSRLCMELTGTCRRRVTRCWSCHQHQRCWCLPSTCCVLKYCMRGGVVFVLGWFLCVFWRKKGSEEGLCVEFGSEVSLSEELSSVSRTK